MSLLPNNTKAKRLIGDLKRRIPRFPCSLEETNQSYSDLLKLQKRAFDNGVSEAAAGERLTWINQTLDLLEQWAAEILKVSEANDIRSVKGLLIKAEEAFSRPFMRTVPLYKMMINTNRKLLKLLAEYESMQDGWVPLNLAIAPREQLLQLMTAEDIEKVDILFKMWSEWVNSGYFDLTKVIKLLESVHPDDVLKNSGYGLLQRSVKLAGLEVTLGSKPLYVRVRSSVISKLIVALGLLIVEEVSLSSIPLSFPKEMIRGIEKTNDIQFRRVCDSRLNKLMADIYPSNVEHVLKLLSNAYGLTESHRTLRRSRSSTVESSKDGMQTRSKRSVAKKRGIRGTVSIKRLEELVNEGKRLLRYSTGLDAHVNLVSEKLNEIVEQKNFLSNLIEDSDILFWYQPIQAEEWLDWMYLYRSELGDYEHRLILALKDLNPKTFRQEIAQIQSNLVNIRTERELLNHAIDHEAMNYEEIEEKLERNEKTVILKRISDNFSNFKNKIKSIPTDLDQAIGWLGQIETIASTSLIPIRYESCQQVVYVGNQVEIASRVVEAGKDFMRRLSSEFPGSVDNFKLGENETVSIASIEEIKVLGSQLREIVFNKQLALSIPYPWFKFLMGLEWYNRAASKVDDPDMNNLIDLFNEFNLLNISDKSIKKLFEKISKKIEKINEIISKVKTGNFNYLFQIKNIISNDVESIRMDIESFHSDILSIDENLKGPVARLSCIVYRIDAFVEQYYEASEYRQLVESNESVKAAREIIQINSVLPDCRQREQADILLNQLQGHESAEIDKMRKYLRKTVEVEEEIESISNRALDNLYPLLKRILKLKISIYKKTFQKFISMILKSAASLVKDLAVTNRKPKWVWLYLLRAIGGVDVGKPALVSSDLMTWLSRQLEASNEILKDSKKSLSDWSRNRFLIPMFHINLIEPMTKIAHNMESKLEIKIHLNYKSTSKQLESISTTGKSTERFFPKVGQSFTESFDDQISQLFENRKVPTTLDEAIDILILVVKDILKSLNASFTGKEEEESSSSKAKKLSLSSSGMSFTKFLSSSFDNIEMASVGETSAQSNRFDWINDMDGLLGTRENFFSRYMDLINKSKEVSESPPPIVSLPVTPAPIHRPVITPPPVALPPGFAPPPSSTSSVPDVVAPISQTNSDDSDRVFMWSGSIEGPKHSYSFNVSLVPFFKSPAIPSSDSVGLKKELSRHKHWTYEGSLSVSKFVDYYVKLMNPAHRKKREPYNFLMSLKNQSDEELFFSQLPTNTATAFAIVIAPYKLKLWILSVDGKVPFAPLPVSPGTVFGMLEMPVAVFQPSMPIENIYGHSEIDYYVSRVSNDLKNFKQDPILRIPLASPPQMIPQIAISIPMSVPVAKAPQQPPSDPLLSRVFEIMGKPTPPEPPSAVEPQPMPRPQYQGVSYYTNISVPKHSSVTNIVIGAPTTGPNIDQLPAPRRGPCRFFNTIQGCQSGTKCRFTHNCTICGSEQHGATFHQQGFSRF